MESAPFAKSIATTPVGRDWTVELITLLAIAVYGVNYYLGRQKVKAVLLSLSDAILPVLNKQFSDVGSKEADQAPYEGFKGLSLTEHRAWATGRRGAFGLLVQLDLAQKQDLLAILISMFTTRMRDRITVEIPLEVRDSGKSFILAAYPVGSRKDIAEQEKDVSLLKGGAVVPGASFGLPGVEFLTEHKDIVTSLLGENSEKPTALLKALQALPKEGFFMHITDSAVDGQCSSVVAKLSPKVLRVQLSLPEDPEKAGVAASALVEALCDTIDTLAFYQLSKDAEKRVAARYADIEAAKAKIEREKLEQLRKMEREKAKIAEAEALKKLPAAERKKIEEKERKRMEKKMMTKGRIVSR